MVSEISTRRLGSPAARVLSVVVAAALALAAAWMARRFRIDAVREFRFEWRTWWAGLALAFGAGGLTGSVIRVRIGRVLALAVVLASALVLVHLPVALLSDGRLGSSMLATTSVVDRTAPQLIAAAFVGAVVVAWWSASARRRRLQAVQ